MLDEMENPTVAYKLGMTMKAAVKDPEQVDRLVSECIKRDVLIEDDSMGNGWRLVDDGGMPIIPQGVKHYVWKSRGDCWALWMGLGCPYGARMYRISDPKAELENISDGDDIRFEDVEITEGKPQLTVVN